MIDEACPGYIFSASAWATSEETAGSVKKFQALLEIGHGYAV